jgi:hypothetical protein
MNSTQTNKAKTLSSSHSVSALSLDSAFTCPRCQGLFVRVFCMDMYDGTGENGFWALRCLQCGELLDPLILQHRISAPQPVQRGRPRQHSPMVLS